MCVDNDYEEYDRKTEELYIKYKKQYGKIINFLYAPDIEAKLTYGTAKQLLNLVKDYNNDVVYGYAGWGHGAMKFNDFKDILKDAVETRSYWGWN